MAAELKISDGLETVDLLNGPIYLSNWRPVVAAAKGGGVFSDSPMIDGRLLEHVSYENAIEAFELRIATHSQNDVEFQKRKINSLLLKAESYWKSRAISRPIYLEWKAADHTNTVYAPIIMGRWSGLGNPFSQPYIIPGGRSTESELVLTVERGHWMSDPPGSPSCVSTKVRPDLPYSDDGEYADRMMALDPYAMWLLNEGSGTDALSYIDADQDGTYVNVTNWLMRFHDGGSVPSFDAPGEYCNIYTTALKTAFVDSSVNNGSIGTICMWIWGGSGTWNTPEAFALRLQVDADNKIELYTPSGVTDELRYRLRTGGVNNDLDFNFDTVNNRLDYIGEWILVALVWGGGDLNNEQIFYINGQSKDLPGDFSQFMSEPWAGIANLSSTNCVIGANDTTANSEWISPIGPTAFYGRELTGAEIQSLLPSTYAIGPSTGARDDEVCGDHVYVGNNYHPGRITLIWADDDTVNNEVWNDGPVVMNSTSGSDASLCYFGSANRSTGGGGLPHVIFSSLVLNIEDPLVTVAGAWTNTWEYYNGATWATLTLRTGGDMFTSGHQILTWTPPSNWATTSVGGFTAYWIRHNVDTTAVTPNAQSLSWSTRAPYTVADSCVEFRDSSPGDLDALATHMVEDLIGDATFVTNRIIAGRRSVSRGESFVSRINISEYGNGPAVKVGDIGAAAGTTWQVSNDTPSGSHWRIVSHTSSGIAYIKIKLLKPDDWFGRHRAFLRFYLEDHATIDYEFWLVLSDRIGNTIATLTGNIDATDAPYNSKYATLDMGIIEIPGIRAGVDDTFEHLNIDIGFTPSTSGGDVNIYDLTLIPVDEWTIDVGPNNTVEKIAKMDSAELMSTKGRVTIQSLWSGVGLIRSDFKGNIPFTVGNEHHKLWFLFFEGGVAGKDADPFGYAGYSGKRNKRYLTPRGSG